MMEEVLLPFHLSENGNLLLPTHSSSNFSPFSLLSRFSFLSPHLSTGEVILTSAPPPMPLCPIQLLFNFDFSQISTSLQKLHIFKVVLSSLLSSASLSSLPVLFSLYLSFFLFLTFQFSFLLFHSRTFFLVFQADDFLED